jgi:hypothetical protein
LRRFPLPRRDLDHGTSPLGMTIDEFSALARVENLPQTRDEDQRCPTFAFFPPARPPGRSPSGGSAPTLVSTYLDRIEAREKVVGAWQYLDRVTALAAARRCDAEPPRGPLHGTPIAVKDLIGTADMPTAYRSSIYRGHRPATDASCVALARAAGAIVLGKTVTTEFATFTPGKTANPRNPAHTRSSP